ncbi:MAG: DUF5698 domain-containing protein [Cyclobacteriaceae bacterium]|nr:DUF5698 domain-containing protein [Cyclobacteriaceae bacterium]
MKTFFLENYGISESIFSYVLLPLLIFIARILDVSINTIRIIFVMSGRKLVSTILGFFESLIWLLAIGQIFKNIDNIASYIAYPLGFATGILVGMLIEEKLALGKVVVRVISSEPFDNLLKYLDKNKMRHTVLQGVSQDGPEGVLFTVINRDQMKEFLNETRKLLPASFYTVESVKQARETGLIPQEIHKRKLGSWMGSVKRK